MTMDTAVTETAVLILAPMESTSQRERQIKQAKRQMSKYLYILSVSERINKGFKWQMRWQLLYTGGLVREDLSEDKTLGLRSKDERRLVTWKVEDCHSRQGEHCMYKGPGVRQELGVFKAWARGQCDWSGVGDSQRAWDRADHPWATAESVCILLLMGSLWRLLWLEVKAFTRDHSLDQIIILWQVKYYHLTCFLGNVQ